VRGLVVESGQGDPRRRVMAHWKYQDTDGSWYEATARQMKELIAAGKILPDTPVESPEGKRSFARRLQGVDFVTISAPQPVPTPVTKLHPSGKKVLVASTSITCLIIAVIAMAFVVGTHSKRKENSVMHNQPAIENVRDFPAEEDFVRRIIQKHSEKFYSQADVRALGKSMHPYLLGIHTRLLNVTQEMSLLDKIKTTQEALAFGIDSFSDIIKENEKLGFASNDNDIRKNEQLLNEIIQSECTETGVHRNIEHCMLLIRNDIRGIDAQQFEKTRELYAILSMYAEAMKQRHSIFLGGGITPLTLREYNDSFRKTLSLAELEW